jgi:hypothetical protein
MTLTRRALLRYASQDVVMLGGFQALAVDFMALFKYA